MPRPLIDDHVEYGGRVILRGVLEAALFEAVNVDGEKGVLFPDV